MVEANRKGGINPNPDLILAHSKSPLTGREKGYHAITEFLTGRLESSLREDPETEFDATNRIQFGLPDNDGTVTKKEIMVFMEELRVVEGHGAKYMNLARRPIGEVNELLESLAEGDGVKSLEKEIDDGFSLGNLLPSGGASPDDEAIFSLLRTEVMDAIGGVLTPKEFQVVCRRWGLEDGVKRTLEEVGKERGISRERIRQIEAKAFEKIRKRRDDLREYIE